jgi:hypothetical protein
VELHAAVKQDLGYGTFCCIAELIRAIPNHRVVANQRL